MVNEILGTSFPVLKEGSLDYSTDGNAYPAFSARIRHMPGDSHSVEIEHRLSGDRVVSELLVSGHAKFGCELILKGGFKRVFHLHDQDHKSVVAVQRFSWAATDVAQKVFFRPVVISTTDISDLELTKAHRVSEVWLGAKISIPKFARIADMDFQTAQVTSASILKIRYDETLHDLAMNVLGPVGEVGQTHFVVKVGKQLHELLKQQDIALYDLRRSILINAYTGVFANLMREHYLDPENHKKAVEGCDILKALRTKLIEVNHLSWTDDPENFSPVKAATYLENFTWSSHSNGGDDID